MGSTYIPNRESDLLTFLNAFAQKITPDATAYGLTVEQMMAFDDRRTAFATAYQVANDPLTRSPANVEKKNTAKKAAIAELRKLVDICQAWPGMTNDKRAELGITIKDVTPTPVPVPSASPVIDVVSVDAWTVRVRLHNGESPRRAKPDGVKGATLFSYVGDQPPADVAAWKFEGSVTRTDVKLTFPTTLAPGTTVWVTAFWFNPTSQSGPAATPVSTQINFGGMARAA